MTALSEKQCEPCHSNAQALTRQAMDRYLSELKKWEIVYRDNVAVLCKTYSFKNFQEALDFSNRVGGLAEANDHHPALLLEWGRVEVSWWTHSLGGLHINDFIMADKTDSVLEP